MLRLSLSVLSVLVVCACSGKAATSTVTCGEGTTLVNNVCTIGGAGLVTCGAGTVLSNGACTVDASGCSAGTVLNSAGVCEPAPTCAAGSTFDIGTKQCVANIGGCGVGTYEVSGECLVHARISLAMHDPAKTGSYDWYALPASEYFSLLTEANFTFDWVHPTFLGTTTGAYVSTSLTDTTLPVGVPQILLFMPAGVPLNLPTAIGVIQVFSPDPDFAPFSGDWPPSLSVPIGFSLVAGDNVLVAYDVTSSNKFAARLVLPDGEPASGEAMVSFTLFADPDIFSIGRIDAATLHEDPLAEVLSVQSYARTTGVSLPLNDDLLTVHNSVGSRSGTLVAVIDSHAPSAEQELVAGQRYACFLNDLSYVVCFDGLAHAAAADDPPTLPTSYKRRNYVSLTTPTALTRTLYNAFGSTITLRQKSDSADRFLRYNLPSVTTFYGGSVLDFALYDTSDALLTEQTLVLPTDSAKRSFLLVAPDPTTPSKPKLTEVLEQSPPAATTIYAVVNGTSTSKNVKVATVSATTNALPAGVVNNVGVATNCPGQSHVLRIATTCYTFDPCARGVSFQHALIVVTAGLPLLVDIDDGDAYTFPAGVSCP